MPNVPAAIYRPWLSQLANDLRTDLSTIARRSGLDPSALTRPMKDKSNRRTMRLRTLRQIAVAMKRPLPPALDEPGRPNGGNGPGADAVDVAVLLAEAIPTGRALSAEDKADLIRQTVARMKARRLVS